jgi:hypothetical protein
VGGLEGVEEGPTYRTPATLGISEPLDLVARVLGHKSLNNWVKAIGLIILIVGFRFDLLAS